LTGYLFGALLWRMSQWRGFWPRDSGPATVGFFGFPVHTVLCTTKSACVLDPRIPMSPLLHPGNHAQDQPAPCLLLSAKRTVASRFAPRCPGATNHTQHSADVLKVPQVRDITTPPRTDSPGFSAVNGLHFGTTLPACGRPGPGRLAAVEPAHPLALERRFLTLQLAAPTECLTPTAPNSSAGQDQHGFFLNAAHRLSALVCKRMQGR